MSPAVSPEAPGRRRAVLAAVVVLALAGLSFAVWFFVLGPGADLRAAEAALARHDAGAARRYLDRRLRWWPDDAPTLLLAARAARRADAPADAERYLARYAAADGPTAESKVQWALPAP